MLQLLLNIAFFVLPVHQDSTEVWPHLRGALYDGRAQSGGLFEERAGLELKWRVPFGSAYSGIAVAQGRVVSVLSDGEVDALVALKVDDGSELWRTPLGPTYRGHDGSLDGSISTPLIQAGAAFALSAHGRLVAVDLGDGKELWSHDLVGEFGATAPEYGFGSTPLVVSGQLVVQVGGTQNRGVCAFDPKSGKLMWNSGEGSASYASPVLMDLGGRPQIVVLDGKVLRAIAPRSGESVWTHALPGERDLANSGVPLPIDGQRFAAPVGGQFTVFQVVRELEGFTVEELYRSRELGRTYAAPVVHEEHVYGFTSDFLTCIELESGKRVWKSRPPGGRGLLLVDDRLVIFGSLGVVVLAQASPDGYVEEARLKVLEHSSYTWPSYAGGLVFVRNSDEMACVKIVPGAGPAPPPVAEAAAPDFMTRWLADVEATPEMERVLMVEALLEEHDSFPILDEGRVHLVWRGEAEDVAVTGSMNDEGSPKPLKRIGGTDLWVASFSIEPGARWEYSFQADYGAPALDPNNPRTAPAIRGDTVSEIVTPGYDPEQHWRTPPSDARGRVEPFEFASEGLENTRELSLWLPPGYDQGEEPLPLLVVHEGQDWIEKGGLINTLDNLVGKSVRPLVAVFMTPIDQWWFEGGGSGTDEYLKALAEELVPMLEAKYRLSSKPEDRALFGMRSFGMTAMQGLLLLPDVFGKAGLQSVNLGDLTGRAILDRLADGIEGQPLVYLDWNRYESRNPDRNTDLAADSRRLYEALQQAGVTVSGGEQLDAYGWGGWRSRSDDWLQALFPID